jgi:hypothetical protein
VGLTDISDILDKSISEITSFLGDNNGKNTDVVSEVAGFVW